MTCSKCGGALTDGQGFWICLRCGLKVQVEPEVPRGPLRELLLRLSHVIALPVAEYLRAPSPYEKLHRLTDTAELLTMASWLRGESPWSAVRITTLEFETRIVRLREPSTGFDGVAVHEQPVGEYLKHRTKGHQEFSSPRRSLGF